MIRLDPATAESREALWAMRLGAIAELVAGLEGDLNRGPWPDLSPIEDYSMRHLAKAAGTTRAALRLLEARQWTDACILTRAVFEQLFTYLWVVQDPERAEVRATMVTIKQEWANAKYLEGLAAMAPEASRPRLLEEAAAYKAVADRLLAELASALGTTEKKVRDEAKLRVSAKAVEVNLGPPFSLPYAHYSGFVHSDGVALASYGEDTPAGRRYSITGAMPKDVPIASDLHRVLLRLAEEVHARCPRLGGRDAAASLAAQSAWLAAADAREHALDRGAVAAERNDRG